MYERILVPLDGSQLARQVLPCVTELATAFGSEIILVGVCEPEETEYNQLCLEYIGSEAEQLEKSLEGTASRVKAVTLRGAPAKKILSYAEKNEAGLIVISSHGRSGIAPWSLGSTANRLLHKTSTPLIIVRARETDQEAAETRLFSRILVPLDISKRSTDILPYITELAKKIECEVLLLQVVEPGKHVHSIGGLEYVPFKDQDARVMKRRSQQYLEGTSTKLADTKAKVRIEVRMGTASQEILKMADEAGCSLIAMASHGHHLIDTWFYGSVTHKVLQASKQSVWLAPLPRTKR